MMSSLIPSEKYSCCRSVAQRRSMIAVPVVAGFASVETSQKGVTHNLHCAGISDHGTISKIRYRPKQRSRTAGQGQW